MSKISNVISFLELLNTGKKYSINELSNILEVTPRMIRLYKEELEKAGIFIDSIRGPYGGYVLNQKVYIPPRDNVDKLNMSANDKKLYNIITKALKEKRKVKLLYKSTETRERIIHPMDLYLYNDSWYVPAYCEYRKGMRHFEFKNIIKIELLNEFYN